MGATVLVLAGLGQGAMAQDAGDEPLDEVTITDDTVPVDVDVSVEVGEVDVGDVVPDEPVFVTECDGCEVQDMAGPGGAIVQRDMQGATDGNGAGVVTQASGNACTEGWLAHAWICTVQGDGWRD